MYCCVPLLVLIGLALHYTSRSLKEQLPLSSGVTFTAGCSQHLRARYAYPHPQACAHVCIYTISCTTAFHLGVWSFTSRLINCDSVLLCQHFIHRTKIRKNAWVICHQEFDAVFVSLWSLGDKLSKYEQKQISSHSIHSEQSSVLFLFLRLTRLGWMLRDWVDPFTKVKMTK